MAKKDEDQSDKLADKKASQDAAAGSGGTAETKNEQMAEQTGTSGLTAGNITPVGDSTDLSEAGHKLTHSDQVVGVNPDALTDEIDDEPGKPKTPVFTKKDFLDVLENDNHYETYQRRGYVAASTINEKFKFGNKIYNKKDGEGSAVVIPQDGSDPFVLPIEEFERDYVVVTPTKVNQ